MSRGSARPGWSRSLPRAGFALGLALLLAALPLEAQQGHLIRIAVELGEVEDLSPESLRDGGLALVVEGDDLEPNQPVFDDGEGVILFLFAMDDGEPVGLWRSRRIGSLTVGRNEWSPDDLPGDELAGMLSSARPVGGDVPYLPAAVVITDRPDGENVAMMREALTEASGEAPDSWLAFVAAPMEPDALEATAIRPLFGILP